MANTEVKVPRELDGARLDKALVALFSGASRAAAKRAVADRAVRVNGRVVAKGDVVSEGDIIAVAPGVFDDSDALTVRAEPDAALDVRFEAAHVLVVDKPARQPTVPLRADETSTLANALAGRYPELVGIGYSSREPGIVHRLDNDTSGLVVVARSHEAFEALKQALQSERIKKEYWLVCAAEGLPDSGTIEYPIANHPKDQRRVYPCIHPRDVMRYAPRPAVTTYSVERRVGPWALVRAVAARAVRHQIRAHFAAIEHPLAGDKLYGGPDCEGLERHALHAASVSFNGDGNAAFAFDVRSPLPADMAALVPST